ncbi:MAG: UvrD-helicase domain-containing protein [Acidobacteriota bacterium]|nr:MAG: UvrD-helicase domain-containing protein [Acidobacteriota bacterium]
MDHGHEIREEAYELRKRVCSAGGLDPDSLLSSESLIAPALGLLDLELSPEPPDSPNLNGALADIYDGVVFINDDLDGGYRHFCIAHEAAHEVLHTFKPSCSKEDIDEISTEEEVPTARTRVVGYGPHERAERDANLFALEFLLPCEALRKAFVENGLTASEIAERTGMPLGYVNRQIARAVLIPRYDRLQPVEDLSDELQLVGVFDPVEPGSPREASEKGTTGTDKLKLVGQTKFSLNPSQKRAVETDQCPVLISAGPGTGKTETLIRRIVHLLNKGADPRRILALTFSNKAAGEMRERIGEARPEDAAKIQIMTFHAFGFNLLRKYWKEAGVGKDSEILDQIDALLMLEGHLADLNLDHYLALYDPMRDLPDILNAISKAKDELCGPEEYRKHAESMLAAAEDDDAVTKGEKALETAGVYKKYQELLDEDKLLDFGDLILRPVKLFEENASVLNEVRGLFDHILVDEFQDVNRASGILLRQVAGEGKGLWAVGDLRQSIYRWRGASPANIRKFEEEYPGSKKLSLETNYRSVEPIVRTFGEFGRGMIAREPFNEWEAFRGKGEGETVTYDVADVFETEAARIAEHILANNGRGTAFRDQAVICRTHAQLASVGEALTRYGVPVFYLGQLFEREEIRDLLSVLDLASSNHCHTILRVGDLDDYSLSLGDQFAIVSAAEDKQCGITGLDPDDESPDLSQEGRASLARLREHLERDPKTSAYEFLTDYLFNRTDYLRGILDDDSIAGKQKLIAIYQLLGFAGSTEDRFAGADDPVAAFLDYIRRLVLFREQKNLAEIPPAASGLDAVRLLTVHGAKGLEFGAVCLPYLVKGKVPANWRGEKCPTPPGLRGDPKDDHVEEEECLFFVALSRAKDRLHLSRSVNYTERSTSNESPFLSRLESVLPKPASISSEIAKRESDPAPPESYTRTEFYAAELDRYLKCARQYYYRYEAGLKGRDNRSAYQKLHGVVFETLRAVQDSRLGPEETDSFARDTMERLWEEAELGEHPYAGLFKDKADELLERVIERFGTSEAMKSRAVYTVPIGNGRVKIGVDSLEESGSGASKRVIARNVKTGKQPANVTTEHEDALLLHALRTEHPDADVSVRNVYLSDDSEYTHEISDTVVKNRIGKYEKVIDSINRREFAPDPDDRKCPTCAYFFMCSSRSQKEE